MDNGKLGKPLEKVAELITVINNPINVSFYAGTPPERGAPDGARVIHNGPIYDAEQIVKLAKAKKIQLWTREAQRDARKWYGGASEITELIITAIRNGKFLGSFWCTQRPDGPWAACDSYRLYQRYWDDDLSRHQEQIDYLKFAISKTGSMLLSISNHPDGA